MVCRPHQDGLHYETSSLQKKNKFWKLRVLSLGLFSIPGTWRNKPSAIVGKELDVFVEGVGRFVERSVRC